MSRLPHTCSLVFACLSALSATCAHSTVFCVGTSQELSDALVNAQMDTNVNIIHLKAGRYVSPTGGFVATINAGSWTIDGGYGNNCVVQQLDARLSIIDGEDLNPGMSVALANSAESLIVSNLTIANGRRTDAQAAALYIQGSPQFAGIVNIERNIFRDNFGTGSGALKISSSNSNSNLRVGNNLFARNQGSTGVAVTFNISGSNNYLSNNTMVQNVASAATTSSTIAIVRSKPQDILNISNTLSWGNSSAFQKDFKAAGDILLNNDFEYLSGTPAAASANNFSELPVFRSEMDFHLASDSNLLDLGNINPPGAISTLDLDGMPRVIDGKTDIGAYGHELLLRDGFESIDP